LLFIEQEDLAFKAKLKDEQTKLKEMQQKAAGKGPLRKSFVEVIGVMWQTLRYHAVT